MNWAKWFPLLGIAGLLIPPIRGMTRLAREEGDEPSISRVYVNMPDLPRSTLLKAASDVVRGRVVATRAVFPDGALGYTEVDIQVEWSLMGVRDTQVTVRFPGAEDGVNVTTVVGGPQVFPGSDVVVLLDRDEEDGVASLVGMNYGLYQVRMDDAGSERVYGTHALGVQMDEFVSGLATDWEESRGGK